MDSRTSVKKDARIQKVTLTIKGNHLSKKMIGLGKDTELVTAGQL